MTEIEGLAQPGDLAGADAATFKRVAIFAVYVDSWRAYACHEIERETKAQVLVKRWAGKPAHIPRNDVAFVGAETDAKRLCERLTSSAALCRQEVNAANERHKKRCANLISRMPSTTDDSREPGIATLDRT